MNALIFPDHIFAEPLVRDFDNDLSTYIESCPDWFVIPGAGQTWVNRIERVLTDLQKEEKWSPTIANVSEILSVNARRLRRDLARENDTFLNVR